MAERPLVFDSGYHMMWSLLDNVTPAQIKAEIPLLEDKMKKANSQITDLNNHRRVWASKLNVLRELIEREESKNLKENFKLTEDHKKIIKAINWEVEDPYGYMKVKDVCELLEYKKPNDEYSDEQYESALKLLKEVPIAVNRFFTGDKS